MAEAYPDVAMTDEVWEKIRSHPQWKGMALVLTDDCWANIGLIVYEVTQIGVPDGEQESPDTDGSDDGRDVSDGG